MLPIKKILCGLGLLGVIFSIATGSTAAEEKGPAPAEESRPLTRSENGATGLPQATALQEKWGIQVVSLRRTAAGHMIDFRYRVLDPEKAAGLMKKQAEAYLIDQVSGKKLTVPRMPKVGALRQTAVKPQEGRTYFVLFGNPGLVNPGSRVTVVIGEYRAENLEVR